MSFDLHSTPTLMTSILPSSTSPTLSGSCSTSIQPRTCADPRGLGCDGFTESEPRTHQSTFVSSFSRPCTTVVKNVCVSAETLCSSYLRECGSHVDGRTEKEKFLGFLEKKDLRWTSQGPARERRMECLTDTPQAKGPKLTTRESGGREAAMQCHGNNKKYPKCWPSSACWTLTLALSSTLLSKKTSPQSEKFIVTAQRWTESQPLTQ